MVSACVVRSVFWSSGRWVHLRQQWGDRVNQHSPWGSGVKLALCVERAEDGVALCKESRVEQEPWLLFVKQELDLAFFWSWTVTPSIFPCHF